jgi:hypothetical protein
MRVRAGMVVRESNDKKAPLIKIIKRNRTGRECVALQLGLGGKPGDFITLDKEALYKLKSV